MAKDAASGPDRTRGGKGRLPLARASEGAATRVGAGQETEARGQRAPQGLKTPDYVSEPFDVRSVMTDSQTGQRLLTGEEAAEEEVRRLRALLERKGLRG
jgi:hypothetical protein